MKKILLITIALVIAVVVCYYRYLNRYVSILS